MIVDHALAAGSSGISARWAVGMIRSVTPNTAENGAIMANPLSVVRSPRSAPRDAVRPLAPAVVERIREAMLHPPEREISASAPGQRARRRNTLPAPGTSQTRQRDALIVSILAYAGLRPGELRALPWQGFRENTILTERAANPDASSKATKNRQHRTVRLPTGGRRRAARRGSIPSRARMT